MTTLNAPAPAVRPPSNHHLDSAPDFYGDTITTRDCQDRLDPLAFVRTMAVARIAMPRA